MLISEAMTSSQILWSVDTLLLMTTNLNVINYYQDLHNLDVTSESVQLTEMDNNKYYAQQNHHGIQEYTM